MSGTGPSTAFMARTRTLRVALAVVAPDRFAEMRRTKDEPFTRALVWQSLSVAELSAGLDTGASSSPAVLDLQHGMPGP